MCVLFACMHTCACVYARDCKRKCILVYQWIYACRHLIYGCMNICILEGSMYKQDSFLSGSSSARLTAGRDIARGTLDPSKGQHR